jgi:hypothetical protein
MADEVTVSARAMHHRLGDLNNRKVIVSQLWSWKTKIKVSVGLSEASLP